MTGHAVSRILAGDGGLEPTDPSGFGDRPVPLKAAGFSPQTGLTFAAFRPEGLHFKKSKLRRLKEKGPRREERGRAGRLDIRRRLPLVVRRSPWSRPQDRGLAGQCDLGDLKGLGSTTCQTRTQDTTGTALMALHQGTERLRKLLFWPSYKSSTSFICLWSF